MGARLPALSERWPCLRGRHRLCCHENIEGTLDVPHGEGGMISHQLCVPGDILVDEDGDGCDVPVANIYKT